jgi:hypothetical protein
VAELTVAIAGTQFQKGARDALARLRPGAGLTLEREAANPYDPFAVAIWRGNLKLGYCPRERNLEVAWALDRGDKVAAVFDGLQEAGKAVVTLRWN